MNKLYPIWPMHLQLFNSFFVSIMGCLYAAYGLHQFVTGGTPEGTANFVTFVIGTVASLYFFPKIKQYHGILQQTKIVNALSAEVNEMLKTSEGYAAGKCPELEKALDEKIEKMAEATTKLSGMMPFQPKKEEDR